MYYYKQVEDGEIVSVEAKSKPATSPNFIEANKAEYDAFIASLPEPEPPNPPRDIAAEIDDHEARIRILEKEA